MKNFIKATIFIQLLCIASGIYLISEGKVTTGMFIIIINILFLLLNVWNLKNNY